MGRQEIPAKIIQWGMVHQEVAITHGWEVALELDLEADSGQALGRGERAIQLGSVEGSLGTANRVTEMANPDSGTVRSGEVLEWGQITYCPPRKTNIISNLRRSCPVDRYLDNTTVYSVRCHVARLVKEPESLPFLNELSQIFRSVNQLLGTFCRVSRIDRDRTSNHRKG